METQLLIAGQPGAIEQAAELLKQGLVVAFPTDTLYGIGADPFNPAAIEQLYTVKNRLQEKGIPVLLADLEDLDKVAQEVPPTAQALIKKYWPGALTLVVPKHPRLPSVISPNEGIAVRIPDHEISRAFIRAVGGAVAATSANRSGERPAQNAAEALEAMRGLIAAVLDGGPVQHGLGSTVLDCMSDPPKVLREGPIPVKKQELGIAETS